MALAAFSAGIVPRHALEPVPRYPSLLVAYSIPGGRV